MTGSMRRGLSRGRSTARAFGPTWRRFFCRRFAPAISLSWTISAATEAKTRVSSFAPSAPSSFFMPKYSPDLNPIEQVFAKLKHLVRKTAARTVDAVCAAIGDALPAFTPEECANNLKNSGYRTLFHHALEHDPEKCEAVF